MGFLSGQVIRYFFSNRTHLFTLLGEPLQLYSWLVRAVHRRKSKRRPRRRLSQPAVHGHTSTNGLASQLPFHMKSIHT